MIVHVATEDELTESLACRLIAHSINDSAVGLKLRKGGSGYLRSSFGKFCQMARRDHVLLLIDLDRKDCASTLIKEWSHGHYVPDKLMLRVCVREAEAWLLADRPGISALMNISEANVPESPEDILDPKEALLNIAKRAPRDIRSELIRARGAIASQGLGYNRILGQFVRESWDPDRARLSSQSLDRAIRRLSALPY